MELYILGLIVHFSIVDLSLSQWSPAEVPRSFTFVTQVGSDGSIMWLVQNEKRNNIKFQCTTFYFQCDAFDNKYTDLYSANITSNSSSFITVFTIKSVTPFQHRSKLFCEVDFPNSYRSMGHFELNVYASPEKPSCDNGQLLNESYIQVNCLTRKVFPGSICLFYINTNASEEHELNQGSISYTHEQNATTGYYKTNCTYTVSAAVLGPGSIMFRVVMYPNITSNITEEMKSISQNTTPIEIYYPKTLLQSDCRINGYVKENAISVCTCYNNNTSIFASKTIWSSVFTSYLNETLQFKAMRNEVFQCKISNALNWTDAISFLPRVSYPPDTVSIAIVNQDFDVCNDRHLIISGICSVSESNPEPTVYLNISNSLTEIKSKENSREYIFNNTMPSTGIFNVACLANSTEYSSIASNNTQFITIKGPPESPIIFLNKNAETTRASNDLLELTQGDTITCQSKGGYPKSKNISLTCGQEETIAIDQDQVTMLLNISSPYNGTCECVVQHESKCIQNRTTVQFKFFTPIIHTTLTDGAIVGIVIAGVALIASIFFIVLLVRRNQGKCYKKPMMHKENERQDLNTISATQYVNTELHLYETEKTKTTYANVMSTPAAVYDLPNSGQATTQYVNTAIEPYQTPVITHIYLNDSVISATPNDNNHEYDTVNNQA